MDISIYNLNTKEVTCEIWNASATKPDIYLDIEDIAQNVLVEKKPQRVQLGLPELGTMFEIMIVPLNNDWNSLRMTGTNENYYFIGVVDYGSYPFEIARAKQLGDIHAGYIKEKLGLDLVSAVGLEVFFIELNNALNYG